MKGVTRLQFMMFYGTFLIFFIYMTGLIGVSVLTGVDGIQNIPEPTGNFLIDIFLPVSYFGLFMSISSTNIILSTFVILPFIIGMVVIIAEFIRGN